MTKKNIGLGGRKVLIADAGFSVMPIVRALKNEGYFVGVCGGVPADPCHSLADESFVIDYSDSKLLQKIFVSNKYQFLVPGCTDISYLSSAKVAAKLGLPGYDSTLIANTIFNKLNFRRWCAKTGAPSPKYAEDISELNKFNYPILAKPVASFSGRGISKILNRAQLKKLFSDGVESEEFIFEEFVGGQLYSHSAFIRNHKIVDDFFVQEYCTVYPYQVNSSCLDASLKTAIKNEVRLAIEKMSQNLDLCDGLIHTQFISNQKQFWFIEVTRRCPGDLYSKLIEYSTGVDYAGLYARSFCDTKLRRSNRVMRGQRYFSRHTLSAENEAIFGGITCTVNSKSAAMVTLKKSGEILRPAPYDRAAVLFFEHSTKNDMRQITPLLRNFVNLN